MDADNSNKNVIQLLKISLLNTITDFLDRGLPLRRITLVASLFKDCNVSIDDKSRLVQRILHEQKEDGGWVDCEDSALALYYISDIIGHKYQIKNSISWLETEKCSENGWGFCKRDKPCIPITSQILYFLTDLFPNHDPMLWVEREWNKDINSPINLNYKASWYLLAFCKLHNKIDLSSKLFSATLKYLITEQRPDGSWGPWRDHPAYSDCFITGITMAALSLSYHIMKDDNIIMSLKRSIQWLKNNQLDNGLFPTHYIEEGSAWIFFGWYKANNIIEMLNL